MEDKEHELLYKMASKITEVRFFLNLRLFLFIVFLIEFFLTLFGFADYNIYYWFILITFLLGTYHLTKKFEKTMGEYEELKKEYDTRFEEQNKI